MHTLTFLLLFALPSTKVSKSSHLEDVVYVSLVQGQTKNDSCGSKVLPCKAIQVGIDKLAWGGLLYIDGGQTSTRPYSCQMSSGKIVVQRSLHIRSYNTMAHISCLNGFTISADNGSNALDASITGVHFKNTVLHLRNVTNVTIQGCIFLESSPAIDLTTTSASQKLYSLNIKATLFKRNRGCIDFLVNFDNRNSIFTRATLKLINVAFEENAASRESVEKVGLVFVNITKCYYSKIAFESIWENVTANRNSINKTALGTFRSFRGKRVRRDPILKSLYVVYTCDANLTFNQVRSDRNHGLRFLGLRSLHSSVRIYKSCFYGHRISGPGGVMYVPDAQFIEVDISDSDFNENIGSIGGVVHIDRGVSTTAKMTLSNVNIRKCSGTVIGSAISAGDIDNDRGIDKLFLVLNGVLFERCHVKVTEFMRHSCGPVCLSAARKTNVIIHNSVFQRNGDENGRTVVFIMHTSLENHEDSTINVQVTKSLFQQNFCSSFMSGLLSFDVYNPRLVMKSKLMISDTVFTNNTGHAITARGIQDTNIHNLTCNNTVSGFCYKCYSPKGEKIPPLGLNNTLIIEKSTFSNNDESSISAQYKTPNFVNIQVRDTVIKDNTAGNQVFLEFGRGFRIYPFTVWKFTVRVLFERVRFISNINNYGKSDNQLFYFGVPMFHKGNVSLVLRQSVFRDNLYNLDKHGSYETRSLFLYKILEDGYSNSRSCENHKNPTCIYRHTLVLNEVTFENNVGPAFIVYITNGKAFFTKCLFKNNYSHEPKAGAHLFVQDGTAIVEVNNTTFIQTKLKPNYFKSIGVQEHDGLSMLFVFAGASGPLTMRNSKFVTDDSSESVITHLTIQSKGYVHIDNFTQLLCPVGSYMDINNGSNIINEDGYDINITRLTFICKMCGVGKYTVERGSYDKGRLSKTKCIEFCPFGADCTWNIQSKSNFWGYYTSSKPPQLNFTRCPEKYCHIPSSMKMNTSVYNACFGNRTGIMCGACKEGFTESIFDHKCRPNEQCRDAWFWVISGLYSIGMTCYFLLKPPIILYLLKNLFWFRKKKSQIQLSTVGEENEEEHGGHGYSKIIFYFYQVADLLMLKSASEILHSYNLMTSVISFYNFNIELTDSKLGCPFPGLTVVTKELFRSAQVFTVMTCILASYLLHRLLSLFKITSCKPAFAPYLAAIIEVLLLGYERLGHTSLILLNCVPLKVHDMVEWRLVLDGNIQCWSNWWQYGLVAYNIVFVVPFLLVLLMGTSKLRCQKITAAQFVAACFVPLPFVIYWLVGICFRRRENARAIDSDPSQNNPGEASRQALLKVVQEPFSPPDCHSRGTDYWESILIGRRLIFLCLYSFISTPMLRMLFMTTVCIAILVHNIIVMPYRDRKTNFFAHIMLFLHVAIAIINLCKSVFITIGVSAVGPTRSQIEGLQFFEVALLGFLPCLFLIIVMATFISQIFRIAVLVFGLIQRCIKNVKMIISNQYKYQPLLNPSEQDSILHGDIQ